MPIDGQTLNQFQAQNIKGAEIKGIEAKGEYRFSQLASAALTDGNNLQTNQPVNPGSVASIDRVFLSSLF